jgi:hypothetical protein
MFIFMLIFQRFSQNLKSITNQILLMLEECNFLRNDRFEKAEVIDWNGRIDLMDSLDLST